jgi:hypothetical protein
MIFTGCIKTKTVNCKWAAVISGEILLREQNSSGKIRGRGFCFHLPSDHKQQMEQKFGKTEEGNVWPGYQTDIAF